MGHTLHLDQPIALGPWGEWFKSQVAMWRRKLRLSGARYSLRAGRSHQVGGVARDFHGCSKRLLKGPKPKISPRPERWRHRASIQR